MFPMLAEMVNSEHSIKQGKERLGNLWSCFVAIPHSDWIYELWMNENKYNCGDCMAEVSSSVMTQSQLSKSHFVSQDKWKTCKRIYCGESINSCVAIKCWNSKLNHKSECAQCVSIYLRIFADFYIWEHWKKNIRFT